SPIFQFFQTQPSLARTLPPRRTTPPNQIHHTSLLNERVTQIIIPRVRHHTRPRSGESPQNASVPLGGPPPQGAIPALPITPAPARRGPFAQPARRRSVFRSPRWRRFAGN